MNVNIKKIMGLLISAALLLPACSNRHSVHHVVHTHVLVDSSDQVIAAQQVTPVSIKKKKRLLKKRNRNPIIGTAKLLIAYGLGVIAMAGATGCLLFGIHAPAEVIIPSVIFTGIGVGAYQIGKSGHNDIVGQGDLESSNIQLSMSAHQRIVL